jgi:hypothetical protein
MRQPIRAWPQYVVRGGAGLAPVLAVAVFATLAGGASNATPATLPAAAAAPESPAEAPSGAVFERFVAGWAGHYDNRRQHSAQLASGVPAAQRNPSLELRIVRIDAPAFGPRAFYAEWFAPDAAATPVRQRIYAFERDAADGAVVLRLHIFPTDAAFVARTAGAWRDPARLRRLTPSDMAPLPGCDVWFRPAGGAFAGEAFAGEMEKGRCRFPSLEDPSREIYSWSQMSKTDRVFSYKDGWFNLDGSVYRSWAPEWYVFEKR